MTECCEVINHEEGRCPVSSMCRWSECRSPDTTPGATDRSRVPRSGKENSGSWLTIPLRTREGTYGYRRIQAILKRYGVRADGSTIRSIMREQGLRAAQPRAKSRTTVPVEDFDERPDLLGRDFTANESGRKLCGDITCISTWAGFVYLAAVPGCCAPRRRQRTRGSPSRAAARGPTGNGLPGPRAPPDPP